MTEAARAHRPMGAGLLRGTSVKTYVRTFLRILLGVVLGIAPGVVRVAMPAASPVAVADDSYLLDFETGGVEEWSPRPADRPYFRVLEYRSDQALRGSRSLYCEVTGFAEGVPPGNEQSLIIHRLPRPVRMDSTTVVSWTWWIRDRETNDGVVLSIYATDSTGQRELYLPWMSHSHYQRGSWPFSDPAGRPVTHSRRVSADTRLGASDPWPPPPWFLHRIEIGFAFPTDQAFFLDDLRVGPAEEAPESSVPRTEGRSLVPDPTFLRLADLDGDGRLDQLIGQEGAPPLLHLARPDGGQRIADIAEAGLVSARSLLDATFGDLDGDGRLDIVGMEREGLRLYRGLGGGEFREMPPIRPRDLALPTGTESLSFHQVHPKIPSGVLVADLLPDPGPEILLLRTVAQQMDSIYSWAGHWRWKAHPLPAGNLGPPPPPLPKAGRYRHGAAVGDVDGDFDLDLVLANIDLMLQTEKGLVCVSAERLPGFSRLQGQPALGDIDNDGDLDLFLPVDLQNTARLEASPQDRSLLWRNDGGTFHDASDWLQAFDIRHAHSPVFEDFDLDGDLDLFFLQSAWSRRMPLRPPNIYLENDGTGRLSEDAGLDSWLMESPPARTAAVCDADDDGDPDLLVLPRGGGPPRLCRNLADHGGRIIVRLLDHRGVPHAGGAAVALYAPGSSERPRRLIAYRQTGAGSVLPGCGEAILACPDAGDFDLVVTWPSRPVRPMARSGLRAGDRLTLVEPAGPGLAGEWLARADVARRRVVDRLALTGWPLLVPLSMLYGIATGIAAYAVRRLVPSSVRPRRADAVWPPMPDAGANDERGWRAPRIRRIALFTLIGIGLLGGLPARAVWPEHRSAQTGVTLAAAGLLFGLSVGLLAAWLDSRRRDALRQQEIGAAEARGLLIEAIDGFSHAHWLRQLSGIAALSRSLVEGVQPEAVLGRLRARLGTYGTVIAPQMQQILQILPRSGLDSGLLHRLREDCTIIERSVESIRHRLEAGAAGGAAPPLFADGSLETLANASGRVSGSIDGIFRELGRMHRSEPAAEVAAAIDAVRERHPAVAFESDLEPALPLVFAAPGELANILENLAANGARAALANATARPPVVRVRATHPGGLCTIRVWDSGAGIEPEKRATLFDARIVDPDRHGRGLPYAHRRLRQLNGQIELAVSTAEAGTEFAITLRTVVDR